SYWRLCNGGSLASWNRDGIPISIMVRCIKQVCETLEYMYQCCPDVVHHCDLHLGNIFLHFEDGSDVPDFYIGDFGSAKVGGQRREWDISRFGPAMESFLNRYSISAQPGPLRQMIWAVASLNKCERDAANGLQSRPTSLAPVIVLGDSFESVARSIEQTTPAFQSFLELGRKRAAEILESGKNPFVYQGLPTETDDARQFGLKNIAGPWSAV
ncbi:hypothetical protein QBC43DRAFT_176017, partial [Cladorrhinum sp. PSN259]